MKTLCLGTLLTCIVALTAAAERERTTEPKRNYQMLVEPAQLQKKLNDSDLRILDVRSTAEYSKGHIPGGKKEPTPDKGTPETTQAKISHRKDGRWTQKTT